MERQLRISASATLAKESSAVLCDKLESLVPREPEIRELVHRLQKLNESLGYLQRTIRQFPGVDLLALEHPLQWWTDLCAELQSRCDSSTANVRDWNNLRHTGGDFRDFGRLLDEYSSVLIVALTYAYFNPSLTTAEELTNDEDLVQMTVEKLHERLAHTHTNIEALRGQRAERQKASRTANKAAEEMKLRTQDCLRLCEQFLAQINQARSSLGRDASSPMSNESEASTNSGNFDSDITIVGNGDSFQLMFTTDKRLRGAINGKGWFNRHGGGSMKDDTIKHITTVLGRTVPSGTAGDVLGHGQDSVRLGNVRSVDQASRYERFYGPGRANKPESAVGDMPAATRTT